MRVEHTLPPDLIHQRAVRVLVIGAGGTGSAIVMGLPYLDQAIRVWGHRYGIEVVMMDADTVSESNCVRQPFSTSDSSSKWPIEPRELYANPLFRRNIITAIFHKSKTKANIRSTNFACSLSPPTILFDLRSEIAL